MELKNHTLVLKEKMPGTRLTGYFFLANGLALAVLSQDMLWKILRVLGGEGLKFYPPQYTWLIYALAIVQLLFFGGMITTALIGGLWLAACPQVRHIEISGDQFTAVMTNGNSRSYSLRDLTSVSPLGTVTFNRVNKLRLFMPPRRVIIGFQTAAQAYLPRVEKPIDVKKKHRASALRIVVFSLLAAVGGYFLVDFFAIPAEDSDSKGVGPIGAALAIFLVGMLHAFAVSSIPVASIRRYHRFTMKRRRVRRVTPSSS